MADNLIGELTRWSDSGAVWRVVYRTSDRAVVALFSCDGGEEMQRMSTVDPAVLRWIGDRTDNEGSAQC